MTNLIRVDPPVLRATARQLREYREQLSRLTDEILTSAEQAPSYEGQFGPKVRALADEAVAQMRVQVAQLEARAEELEARAEKFEAADRAALEGFSALFVQFQNYMERFGALLAGILPSPGSQSVSGFDTSIEDFQAMSAEQRLAWIEALNGELGDAWFANFIDVLHYFNNSLVFTGLDGSTPPSLWMSWGDAAVLQAVQDGYVLAQDPDAELPPLPVGTPAEISAQRQVAAVLWAEFFTHRRTDRYDDEGLMRRWGMAEQAGVNYGVAMADLQLEQQGVELAQDDQEVLDVFVRFGNAYRSTIANDAGAAVFEAAPRTFGAEIGQRVWEGAEDQLQESILKELGELGNLVEIFTGEGGKQFVDRIAEQVAGDRSLLERTDAIGHWIGGQMGQGVGDSLDPHLGEAGTGFHDPRLQFRFELEASSPIGGVDLEAELRGPVYHLSMTVENLLLSGNAELAHAFLETVEETVEQVVGLNSG